MEVLKKLNVTVQRCIIIICLVSIGVLNGYAQSPITLFKDYNNFVEIKRITLSDKDSRLITTIKEIEPSINGAEYVNSQPLFWTYLLNKFSQQNDYKALEEQKDTVVLQREFVNLLEKDSLFAPLVMDYDNIVVQGNGPKDTIRITKALNIAVKFFNIERITKEGSYVGKICIGSNEIVNTEKQRYPFVEAFAFDAVMRNNSNEEYNLYAYFIESVKNIYKVNMGIEEKDRLLRTQGALYIQMMQYDKLKQLLVDEYQKNKDILPFILSF